MLPQYLCEYVPLFFPDTQQELESSKSDRDQAYTARSVIMQERESIRTLCDILRRERDRAGSALAETLRDRDDLKRQKTEANKVLKDVK